ncbi:Superoxide dismutase-like [Cu-Zn] [Leptotrombidium deliense]|uniref:Superoxide dismutase-like [Cu-Zn] n=1 Tax=Leptotrombidium deliense TaxID=299467 RepID=A0A443RV58_9ACAR|nr:Superoxide dismutase-like [Cu-Zn] [Leptotrombidium deliense]
MEVLKEKLPLKISLEEHFSGFEHGEHPIHIHVANDLTNGCRNTKAIFNLLNETMQCPGSPFMIGHLHTLVVGINGRAKFQINKLVQIMFPFNIRGRAIVIHDKLKFGGAVTRGERMA